MLALGWGRGCGSDAPPARAAAHRRAPHHTVTSLLCFAFLERDLTSFRLFLLAILREVGGEEQSRSPLPGCLFGRKRTAEGRHLKEKKKLNLSGKTRSEKVKSKRAQDKETHKEGLERGTALLLMTGTFVLADFWLFNTVS